MADLDPAAGRAAFDDALAELAAAEKGGTDATIDNTKARNGFGRTFKNLPTGVKVAAAEFSTARARAETGREAITIRIDKWISNGKPDEDVDNLRKMARGSIAGPYGRTAATRRN